MSAAAARRRKQLAKKKKESDSNASSYLGGEAINEQLKQLLETESSSSTTPESVAYEALQLAQSQIRRNVKTNQIDEAISMAYEVSMNFLEKKSRMVSVTSQLLALLVEVLNETKAECTEELVKKIEAIDSAYHKALADGYDLNVEKDFIEVERLNRVHLQFLKRMTKWSSEYGAVKHGHYALHGLLGEHGWKIGSSAKEGGGGEVTPPLEIRAEAISHLALAEKPLRILEILKTLPEPTAEEEQTGRNGGSAAERDCHLTRAILVFLALENMRDGNALLNGYVEELNHKRDVNTLATSYMKKTDGFAPTHFMFCNMLLQVCGKDRAGPLFQWLLKNFGSDLSKMKPDVSPYTTKIGKVYFGIMPPPSMLNMMENMMSMMGGAGGMGGMNMPVGGFQGAGM